MAETSFFEKLESIDRRILAWILIFVIAFPYLNPLGIPIEITEPASGFYDTMDALEPGSAVMIVISLTPSSAEEVGAGCTAMVDYLANKYPASHGGEKLKLLLLMASGQGLIVWENFGAAPLDASDYVYGEDYVNLGFISGGETMIARMADDISSLVGTDNFGTPLKDIPMMSDINDYNDIALIVPWDASEMASHVVKHWATKGVDVGSIIVGGMVPTMTTFMKAGDMVGFIGGSRGSAELELLIGEPGSGLATTDTLSLSHLYLIILIIIGNIGYVVKKMGGNK